MSQSSHLRAIFFAVLGFTFWVGGDTFMKLAGETGTPKYEIMTIGGFGGLVSIFLVTALRGELKKLRPKKKGLLAILGLMFLMNYGVWLTALARLPLANFYTVLFLAPTVGAIFAALFLRERLGLQKILVIIIGFIGVLIAINPSHLLSDQSDWVGYGVAFLGMFVIVAQMLTLRYAGNHESRESIAFYPRLAAIAGGLIATVLFGFEALSLKGFIYSLLTGAIGGMGWMFLAHAYKLAPAATVAPFQYSEIISGAFFGFLVWHDIPSVNLLIGAFIIIVSGLYIVTHVRRAEMIAKTLVDNP